MDSHSCWLLTASLITFFTSSYVWGALFREKGRSYEVIPTRDRVVDKAIEWECNIWAKREDKGNKGMNGVELPDETEDKMMKLMHVHFIKDLGWAGDGLDLGPVEGKGPFYKTTMQASVSLRAKGPERASRSCFPFIISLLRRRIG